MTREAQRRRHPPGQRREAEGQERDPGAPTPRASPDRTAPRPFHSARPEPAAGSAAATLRGRGWGRRTGCRPAPPPARRRTAGDRAGSPGDRRAPGIQEAPARARPASPRRTRAGLRATPRPPRRPRARSVARTRTPLARARRSCSRRLGLPRRAAPQRSGSQTGCSPTSSDRSGTRIREARLCREETRAPIRGARCAHEGRGHGREASIVRQRRARRDPRPAGIDVRHAGVAVGKEVAIARFEHLERRRIPAEAPDQRQHARPLVVRVKRDVHVASFCRARRAGRLRRTSAGCDRATPSGRPGGRAGRRAPGAAGRPSDPGRRAAVPGRRQAPAPAGPAPPRVAEIAMRRPSSPPRVRVSRPRSTSRLTTTDTELWWVKVRAASSFSDNPGAAARRCSTNSCAAPMPTDRSVARDDSRSARTMRRIASRTWRVAGSADVPDFPTLAPRPAPGVCLGTHIIGSHVSCSSQPDQGGHRCHRQVWDHRRAVAARRRGRLLT